jgi:hypothetical protein
VAGQYQEEAMRSSTSLAIVAVAALFGAATFADTADRQPHAAQTTTQHDHSADPQSATPAPGTSLPAGPDMRGGMMMAEHASTAQLDALVAKMNAATGQARIDAMAELLTALVQHEQSMKCMMDGAGLMNGPAMMNGRGMMPMHEMMNKPGDAK